MSQKKRNDGKNEKLNKIFEEMPENSCKEIKKGDKTLILCKDKGQKRYFRLITPGE